MKTQQAAEREEQQRIKNLVLNYDLRDGEEQDGDSSLHLIPRNPNIHVEPIGLEKAAATANYSRTDKSGNTRSGQRARKLQLSDVDWYGSEQKPQVSHVENVAPPTRGPCMEPSRGALPLQSETNQQKKPRTNGRGRLTRKEIAQEHASRNASKTGTPASSPGKKGKPSPKKKTKASLKK